MTKIKNKIYIKLKKKKHNKKNISIEKENIFIIKIKKILKIMIIIISLFLTIIFIRYCYCNYKIYKLNKKINCSTLKTLNCFYSNLESTLENIIKNNNVNIPLSQITNINQILKFTADAINSNIILNENGIITEDGYLGIYNYIYENLSIKKCIYKKIPINNFFINNEGKLVEKKFSINDYSLELMNNITQYFYNQ